MRKVICMCVLYLMSSVCMADSVYLKDGQVFRGDIVSQDNDTVVIETYGGNTESIDKVYVNTIIKDESYRKYRKKMRTGYLSGNQWVGDEWILKLGVDFRGKHETSSSKLSIEGVGDSSVDGTQDVTSGLSFGGEYVSFESKHVGFGGGITMQFARGLSDVSGNFSFTPLYGLIKVRTTPTNGNHYKYLIGQLGYNFFTGDIDYSGRHGSLDGGLYFGVGAGIALNRIQLELLYSEDRGRARDSGTLFDPGTGVSNNFTEAGDIRYSKLGISIGFIF
jgi:hypothetical protein